MIRLVSILFALLTACVLLLASCQPAHASGFYAPPWAEALFWLLLTPAGWAVLGVAAVAVIALIVRASRD